MIEFLGCVATVTVAVVLLYGLWFAKSYTEGKLHQSQKHRADDAYQAYLALAFDNPDYALPDALDGLEPPASSDEDFVQYTLFVAYLLQVCEQVLTSCPTDIHWKIKLKRQLSYHKSYLFAPEFQSIHSLSQYSPELQAFLKVLLDESTIS